MSGRVAACPSCGTALVPAAPFCHRCGSATNAARAVAPKQPAEVQAEPAPLTVVLDDGTDLGSPAAEQRAPARGRSAVRSRSTVLALALVGALLVAGLVAVAVRRTDDSLDGALAADGLSDEDRSGVCNPFQALLTWAEENPPPDTDTLLSSSAWILAAEAQEEVAAAIVAMRDHVPRDLQGDFDSNAQEAEHDAEFKREHAPEAGYMGDFTERLEDDDGKSSTDRMTEFVERACGQSWPSILEPGIPYTR